MNMKIYIYLLTGILTYWGMCAPDSPKEFDLNRDGCVDCMDLMQLFWNFM